jgi:hypothetical protein
MLCKAVTTLCIVEYARDHSQIINLKVIDTKLELCPPDRRPTHTYEMRLILQFIGHMGVVTAARVRPSSGERDLLHGPLLQQELVLVVEQEKRECAVQLGSLLGL